VGKVIMKSDVEFRSAQEVEPGDVIVDRFGNEMVIVEILDRKTGECFALFNGTLKRINTGRVSKVIAKGKNDEELADMQ
tara:strand:+ start:971 stop:1207 length:237 start_codon:yes stop_codon:yes gene_type:complete